MARIVKFHAAKNCYNKNCDRFNGTCLSACTNQFYGEKCDKGIIVPYPLCKIIPTAIQRLPKGRCFYKSIIARKKCRYIAFIINSNLIMDTSFVRLKIEDD